jgi:5-bromo-4-chloroindolyl phosphate hydrolysis protein
MQGVITYEVISLLSAFGLGVSGVIIALYRVRDELKEEIKQSRHKLRNELQADASKTDAEIALIERQMNELAQRVTRVEAKLNGRH